MLSRVSLLGLCLIFHASLIACSFDFSVYPLCAQPGLQNNAPVSCDYGSDQADITLTDDCLCGDNGFVEGAAAAIYTSCGCDVLTTSAQLMYTACTEYAPGFLQFSVAEIIYAGDGGQSICGYSAPSSSASPAAPSTTPTSAPTTTPTSAPTTTPAAGGSSGEGGTSGGGSKLSLAGIIGIIASICTIIGLPIAIWMCCCRGRYQRLGQ